LNDLARSSKYGVKDEAELIRPWLRENYDPYTGCGLGGRNFSWTAALTIGK
jgi:hypothetical protein